MEVYAAMVDRMDQNVGKIVAELRASGQLENTLILYLQDNGACAEPTGRQNPPGVPLERPDHPTLKPWGPDYVDTNSTPKQTRDGYPIRRGPGVMPGPGDTHIAYGQAWANVSNTPFREYKHWEHEGGISTPLIAHWPAGIKRRGELEGQPGHLIDVMATLVDVSRAAYPKEFKGHEITPMEGRSLVPAFEGKAGAERAIYFEHEGNRAVREGRWKLVAKGPRGGWELYDMEADRTETNDLASANPEKVKDLAAKWDAWAKRAHVLPWPWKAGDGVTEGGGKSGKFSVEKHFALKPGEVLAGARAPDIADRAITITAKLASAGDGVIVAQGGTAHGFSLYVKDGVPTFAARINNKLHTVAGTEKVPAGGATITAKLARDGAVTLSVGGKEAGSGKFPRALARTPVDPLSVGQDTNAAVGDYPAPWAFKGTVTEVSVDLE
jgi:arylsulfatase